MLRGVEGVGGGWVCGVPCKLGGGGWWERLCWERSLSKQKNRVGAVGKEACSRSICQQWSRWTGWQGGRYVGDCHG
jgi:hypothetical protein